MTLRIRQPIKNEADACPHRPRVWESIRCNKESSSPSLIVQYDVQERSMDRQLAVVLNESHLAEAVHEKIHA